MDIYHSMVPAQQVEDTRLKRKNRKFKKAKSYERGNSKVGLKSNTILGSRRGSPAKVLTISQG